MLIDVTLEVGVVADCMFPKAALPDSRFAPPVPEPLERTPLNLVRIPMKLDRIRRVGKGALLRAVPTRGHVAGASAGSFAHPTILFDRNTLQAYFGPSFNFARTSSMLKLAAFCRCG